MEGKILFNLVFFEIKKIGMTAGLKLIKAQIPLLLKKKAPIFRLVLSATFAKVQNFGKGFYGYFYLFVYQLGLVSKNEFVVEGIE
jgi:hypothetical protein